MRNEWNIWVVGGDLRQVRLAQLLGEEGHSGPRPPDQAPIGLAQAGQ